MIGYVVVGTNDLNRSAAFYDEILGIFEAERIMEESEFIVWAFSDGACNFSVHVPFDGQSASVGNGVMVALRAESPSQVTAIHMRALALGAKDEGVPGPRHGNSGFFAAYFRDLDGNKLNVHCMVDTHRASTSKEEQG